MLDQERREAIHALIRDYTTKNTVDQKTARAALYREGIYTKDGQLRPEFGGPPLRKSSKSRRFMA
jgi:hypothetical protein